MQTTVTFLDNPWTLLGVVGGLIFYGRFYVQWIASEIQRRSVVPVVFWYMSSIGSLMLLAYAAVVQSPVGALGQCLNIIIYSRNLVHIWRGNGRLSERASVIFHVMVGLVAAFGIGIVVYTWFREYTISQAAQPEQTRQTWLWLSIGLAGQALFASRFLVQWIATERRRKSVVPPAFWYLSILAASLQVGCFVQRGEWVFAVGMLATILIYGRNIYMILRPRHSVDAEE